MPTFRPFVRAHPQPCPARGEHSSNGVLEYLSVSCYNFPVQQPWLKRTGFTAAAGSQLLPALTNRGHQQCCEPELLIKQVAIIHRCGVCAARCSAGAVDNILADQHHNKDSCVQRPPSTG
jgi:hypothetical protein